MPKTSTLLILSPGFPADESDSTCLPLQQQLVRAFNRLMPQLDIVVVSFQYPHRQDEYNWFGNRIIPLNGRGRGKLGRLVTWYRAWRAIRRVKRERPVNGILSFWVGECALIGHHFAQRHGVVHRTWILGQDARPGNWYAGRLRKYPQELVALSDFLVTAFEENYAAKPMQVVPAGITASDFATIETVRDIDIMGAGSLIPLKRYDIFIAVVHALKQHYPSINATLCGAGPLLPELKQQAQQLGLESNITFTGEISHEETLKHMQRSRVFFHPSSYEGFSGACLEALYAGAHVVSFFAPMHAWIRHWHIVGDEKEAVENITALLRTPAGDNDPVLPYRIEDSAKEMLELFGFTL